MSKTTYLKTEDGMLYEQGYSNCWYSLERGVPEGTMRIIDRKAYYACSIYPQGTWLKPKVVWSPVADLPYLQSIIHREFTYLRDEEKRKEEDDEAQTI